MSAAGSVPRERPAEGWLDRLVEARTAQLRRRIHLHTRNVTARWIGHTIHQSDLTVISEHQLQSGDPVAAVKRFSGTQVEHKDKPLECVVGKKQHTDKQTNKTRRFVTVEAPGKCSQSMICEQRCRVKQG